VLQLSQPLRAQQTSLPTHELLWSFHSFPRDPSNGALVLGPDGYYWGTTEAGGATGQGTIYKAKADGSDWKLVLSFTGGALNIVGAEPRAGLVSDGLGSLWGTTYRGGAHNVGTVFKVNAATGALTTLVEFSRDGGANRGAEPRAELVADGAGFFWGTTSEGGLNNGGTVFKVNANTGELTTIAEFSDFTMGYNPLAGLTSDGAGFLWGSTASGGTSGAGTIFKINRDSGALTTVAHLNSTDYRVQSRLANDGLGFMWGAGPRNIFKVKMATGELITVHQSINLELYSGLVADGAGSFWGATAFGGDQGLGAVFKIDILTGELTTIASFSSSSILEIGDQPFAPLTMDVSGDFLGTNAANGPTGGGVVFKVSATTHDIQLVAGFTDEHLVKKGTFPYAGVVSDGAGFLWGTTQHGGLGHGTVFKLDEITGELTTLVQFTNNGTVNRGAEPRAMLVADGKGYLWGSTSEGGIAEAGTLFAVNISTGELVTIVEFTRSGITNRGARPNGELIDDGHGFFWGTTFEGGAQGLGTVFKVNQTTGELTTVYEHTFGGMGYGPYAALSPDGAGSFWGTTNRGGFDDNGTIFKLNASTAQYTRILLFTGRSGPALGTEPRAKLFNDRAGSFWGITSEGGLPGGARGLGTIFKIDAATNQLTTVVQFTGNGASNKGSEPRTQVISDGVGSLWGTTWTGGIYNQGTVYKLNPATDELTTVLNFTGLGNQSDNGSRPGYGALLLHKDGNFYGTTQEGGPEGGGTVFRLRFGPTPLTLAAAPVGPTRATLRGTINPNGNATGVSFQIGTSQTLKGASTVSAGTSTAGNSAETFQQTVTGLQPSTVYYYRIIGTNAANEIPQVGAIRSFTTPANTIPVVTLSGANPLTLEASSIYTDPGATASDAEDGTLTPVLTNQTVVPGVPGAYSVTWSATDLDGSTGAATRLVNVVDTTPPVVLPPASITVSTADPAGSVVTYTPANATDFVGVVQTSYSHPSGSLFPLGTTTVIVTATDAAGNSGTGTFNVRVLLTGTVHQILAAEGSAVPGAGIDPRIPAGAVWAGFGTPAISATGQVAFTARWIVPTSSKTGKGLFLNDTLLAAAGESSPVAGTTFGNIKAPAFGEGSNVVLVSATISGPTVTTDNDSILLSFAPTAPVLVREGDKIGLGGGVRVSSFLGATLVSGKAVVLVRLREREGFVDSTNNLALVTTGSDELVTLARTGQTLLGKTLKAMNLLKPVSRSTGQGRSEASANGVRFAARFTDQTQGIVELGYSGEVSARALSGDQVGTGTPASRWSRFGPLSNTADGSRFAFRAQFVQEQGSDSEGEGIFLGDDAGFTPLVRVGEPAPASAPASFATLRDPVLSGDGTSLAFIGRLQSGTQSESGIFALRGNGPLATVTTLNTPPPGVPTGSHWKVFTSLAVPGGELGPVFRATLETGGSITTANDSGLWAVDSSGVLRSLVREGELLQGKTVKSIQVLEPVSGTSGLTRAFNSRHQIIWKGTFTDQTAAVVLTTVP
jgi:uncharacterized repeat protein (TIGR03803 family)